MSKIKIFALGGLNENGKNMYVVDVNNDVFIFDAGLKYDNDLNLGIDYIIPNYNYLIENKERIKGVFLTHGHEGNMGAIPDILEKLPQNSFILSAFHCAIRSFADCSLSHAITLPNQ